MNKHIAAALTQMGMSVNSNLATGRYKGFEINAFYSAFDNVAPTKIHISCYTTDEQKRQINDALRAAATKYTKYSFTQYGLLIGMNDLTAKRLAGRLQALVDMVADILKNNGALGEEFCPVCGKPLNTSEHKAYTIDGIQITLDSDCLNSINKKIEAENADLVKQIAAATVEEAATLRQQYNRNKDEITRLASDLSAVRKKQDELAQAKEEAAADNAVPTDDYYRIPALMQECKNAYSLTWQGDGWWSGYSYLREATAPNINGTITFKATLSIARKPKYFLGIKIHRAILQISWELTAEYSDTEVVDIIELEPGMSEAEKSKMVNDRLSEIANQYPSCEITTEYVKSEPVEEDTSTDTYHLLWASDRLEIARQVETRLTQIYADLVSLEKMMNYRLSIIDVLKDIAPFVNDERGRRLTLVEECRRRWLRGAANSLHSVDYNGKYEETDESREGME